MKGERASASRRRRATLDGVRHAGYCAEKVSVCVIDDQQVIVLEQKLPNDLGRIRQALQPSNNGTSLQVVVESIFNWYWLVDGLQTAGFEVCLAYTLGLRLITRAKVKTNRRDAYTLAKLLRAGLIPKAYIYPTATRPVPTCSASTAACARWSAPPATRAPPRWRATTC